MSKLILFMHNGKAFCMTAEEIEAAYRYQEHYYRLEDAKSHLKKLVFGCDDGSDFDDPEDQQTKDDFAEEYGISYDQAVSENMLEEYLLRFGERFDCNQDENSQWEAVIKAALNDVRNGVMPTPEEDTTVPQQGEDTAASEGQQAKGIL